MKKSRFMARYSTPLNKELFQFIPVVYGAVLSFGFYILTICFSDFYGTIRDSMDIEALGRFVVQIGLFTITTLYLVIDLGGMVKVTKKFGYQLHSRFIHDIFIGLTFLIMYNEIKELSAFYFLAFSVNMIIAAIWGNNLKEEAERSEDEDKNRYCNWGVSIRQTHFLGASIFLFLFGICIVINLHEDPVFLSNLFFNQFDLICLTMLVFGFYIWYVYFLIYTVTYNGATDREFSIPVGMPVWLIKRIMIIGLKKRKRLRARLHQD